jgi:hypothetical protein
MDTQNRLLAMLNSATSPPPSQKAQSNSRSPPPPTSSRVPSTSSPPPTLQAVSLQDLFKAMSPPPAQQQKQEGSLPPQQEQQAKLLGMLQGLGGPPSAAPARMPSGSGRVASGVSTPDVAGVQGRKVTLMPKSSYAVSPCFLSQAKLSPDQRMRRFKNPSSRILLVLPPHRALQLLHLGRQAPRYHHLSHQKRRMWLHKRAGLRLNPRRSRSSTLCPLSTSLTSRSRHRSLRHRLQRRRRRRRRSLFPTFPQANAMESHRPRRLLAQRSRPLLRNLPHAL